MTGTITLGTCDLCAGAGTVPHSSPGETYSCSTCNGHGVAKRAGYGDGTGTLTYPLTLSCYRCDNGLVIASALPGQAWPADATRHIRYQSGRGEAAKAYAEAVTVVVQAANRAGTWNEAYLGLGSIVSTTDYGRVWDAMVKAAADGTLDSEIETVRGIARKQLAEGTQWIKLTREDDTLAEVICITVHRNGYIVQASGARPELLALPPTYTSEVLNAPVR
jgi:hypothetical protein